MIKYLVLFILLISSVTALNCTYDKEPFIAYKQSIDWNCFSNITEGRCYGVVLFANEILHIYPDIAQVKGEGIIDYFKLDNGLVSIKFETNDLYENYNYTMRVICSDKIDIDQFETNVVPFRQDLLEVAYRGVWIKENMSMIFMILFIVSIVGILLWAILKR